MKTREKNFSSNSYLEKRLFIYRRRAYSSLVSWCPFIVKISVTDPDPNLDTDPPDPHILGLPDPDPDSLVKSMDPDPDPSIIKQKYLQKVISIKNCVKKFVFSWHLEGQ